LSDHYLHFQLIYFQKLAPCHPSGSRASPGYSVLLKPSLGMARSQTPTREKGRLTLFGPPSEPKRAVLGFRYPEKAAGSGQVGSGNVSGHIQDKSQILIAILSPQQHISLSTYFSSSSQY